MDKLPQDVIRELAPYLDLNDIRSLRLTNRALYLLTIPHFFDRLVICARYFDIEVANKILDKYSSYVKELTVYWEPWRTNHSSLRGWSPNSKKCKMHLTQLAQAEAMLMEEGRAISTARQDIAVLERALTECPILRNVIIANGQPRRLTSFCPCAAAQLELQRREHNPWKPKYMVPIRTTNYCRGERCTGSTKTCTGTSVMCRLGSTTYCKGEKCKQGDNCSAFNHLIDYEDSYLLKPDGLYYPRECIPVPLMFDLGDDRAVNTVFKAIEERRAKLITSISVRRHHDQACSLSADVLFNFSKRTPNETLGQLTRLELDLSFRMKPTYDDVGYERISSVIGSGIMLEELCIQIAGTRNPIYDAFRDSKTSAHVQEYFPSIIGQITLPRLKRLRIGYMGLRPEDIDEFVDRHEHLEQFRLVCCGVEVRNKVIEEGIIRLQSLWDCEYFSESVTSDKEVVCSIHMDDIDVNAKPGDVPMSDRILKEAIWCLPSPLDQFQID